jgi:hypothetical protein
VAQPQGLDPGDDLALTGDRLGNLLDDERPREVLDDPGPASSWPQPFQLAASAQGWPSKSPPSCLLAFRRPAARTSGCPPIQCGRLLPTPARVSDTSDVTGSALNRPWSTRLAPPIPRTPDLGTTTGQLNPLDPQPVVEGSYAGDQQPGVAFVGVTGDQVGEGACCSGGSLPQAATGFGLPNLGALREVVADAAAAPSPRVALRRARRQHRGGAAGPGAAGGSPRGRRRSRRPAGPRRRDGSARPRLARRAAPGRAALVGRRWRAGSSSGRSFPTGRQAGSAAAAGSGRRRGPRDRDPRRRSAASVGGGRGQQPGACWACRGSASPGHGSRVAAASVSVARKRRHADRAGGDLW